MNADILENLLTEANYDDDKLMYIIDGFRHGFDLGYTGPMKNIRKTAPNLKFRVGNEVQLWNKVMKEVKLKRYAGPFREPPYKQFIQSPIGLVPKDSGRDTRLIFHLSYPKNGKSVNSYIPQNECSVSYPNFDEAIELIQSMEAKYAGKSDMKSAFRNLPLKVSQFCLLLMKAKCPLDGVTYWFVDKCLPFGSSKSCKIFQDFSDCIAHLVTFHTKRKNVNYLDDFLFVALLKAYCDRQLDTFIEICGAIGFPVAMDKTTWGEQTIVFLGLLIDLLNEMVCIPKEKVTRAVKMIQLFKQNKKHKATVLQIQRLAGYLNFLCKCIVPGRVFTRRLYSLTSNKLKPYHHIRLPPDVRQDLDMWLEFLTSLTPLVYCRPFIDYTEWTAEDIDMYSDASGSFSKGYGAYCKFDWVQNFWCETDGEFFKKINPSIEYLELYGVTVAVYLWIHRFKNKRIKLYCDNNSVCGMINSTVSTCKNCMVLLKIIALQSIKFNVKISAEWINTDSNVIADALSRGQWDRFWHNAPKEMNKNRTIVPDRLWPIRKIWIK